MRREIPPRIKPPSIVCLTTLNSSLNAAEPNVRSHSLSPAASTLTTQQSKPPKCNASLLPPGGELDLPANINPPSDVFSTERNVSLSAPPKVLSHCLFPSASTFMTQPSESPK